MIAPTEMRLAIASSSNSTPNDSSTATKRVKWRIESQSGTVLGEESREMESAGTRMTLLVIALTRASISCCDKIT